MKSRLSNKEMSSFSVGKCMSLATQECPSKKVQRRGSGSISPLRQWTTDRLTTLDEELGFNSLPEVVVLFLTNCVLSTCVLLSPDLYAHQIWMIWHNFQSTHCFCYFTPENHLTTGVKWCKIEGTEQVFFVKLWISSQTWCTSKHWSSAAYLIWMIP